MATRPGELKDIKEATELMKQVPKCLIMKSGKNGKRLQTIEIIKKTYKNSIDSDEDYDEDYEENSDDW